MAASLTASKCGAPPAELSLLILAPHQLVFPLSSREKTRFISEQTLRWLMIFMAALVALRRWLHFIGQINAAALRLLKMQRFQGVYILNPLLAHASYRD